MSQEKLAVDAETTQATISRIEAGRQTPGAVVLINLARELRLDPARLLRLAKASKVDLSGRTDGCADD